MIQNELLVVITNYACSLQCRDCANFIHQIPTHVKRQFIEPDSLKDDLQKLSAVLRTDRIQIQGGESTLHSDLPGIIGIVASSGISGNIQLVTNATGTLPDDTATALKWNKTNVRISNYDARQQKIAQWESKLKEYGVDYSLYKYAGGDDRWYDLGEYRMARRNNDTEVAHIYETCPFKVCWTLSDGLLTKCSRSASGYLSGHHEYFADDIVNVREATVENLSEKIRKLQRGGFLEACRYCNGTTGKRIRPGIQIGNGSPADAAPHHRELRAAFYYSMPFQLRALEPIAAEFDATLLSSSMQEIERWMPHIIFTSDAAQLPQLRKICDAGSALLVGLRHGVANKYIPTDPEYALADYVCGSDWDQLDFESAGVRPRRQFLRTGNPWIDGVFKIPRRDRRSVNPTILFAPTYNPEVSAAIPFRNNLVELIRSVYPESVIIIKPHPAIIDNDHPYVTQYRELFAGLMKNWKEWAAKDSAVRVIEDSKSSISDYYDETDILVSDGSSLIFEFMALNRPILLYTSDQQIGMWSHLYDQKSLSNGRRNVGAEFKTEEEFQYVLKHAFQLHDEKHSHFQEQYSREIFGMYTDGLSAHRVAEAVKTAMRDQQPKDVRLIAFYLPQFHPIPENDLWWGKGFTEWTNVAKATPVFPGHYQPHVPADLGFYDLRMPQVREAQATMAREYGISGFCYYHYWFNGHQLLQQPLDDVLKSGSPDFPFCLCWANEKWTRTWDGATGEILIDQVYSEEDDLRHIQWLADVFRDGRYIRVQGKPLFMVYRAKQLPDPLRTTAIWRDEARRLGIGELYLCRVEGFIDERDDPRMFGFDAAIEFAPDWEQLGSQLHGSHYGDHSVFRYPELADRMLKKPIPAFRRYPCVTPAWDNAARRKNKATIVIESTPKLYEDWLRETIRTIPMRNLDEPLVFLNAWNEWGEGNHLEPDQKYGKAYLEATQRALSMAGRAPATTDPDEIHEKAIFLANAGDAEGAILALENLLEIHPQYALGHNDLGVLYFNTEEFQKAHDHYQQAVVYDPENALFQKNLADFLFVAMDRTDDAIAIYTTMSEGHPDDKELLQALGLAYLRQGNREQAAAAAGKLLALDPANAEAKQILTRVNLLRNDVQSEETVLFEGTSQPEEQELYNAAQSKIQGSDYEGAIQDLENLLAANPELSLAHNDLGVLYHIVGKTELALSHYERAVELSPDSINFLKNLADFYAIAAGRITDAIKIYREILAEHPTDLESLIALGNTCAVTRQFDEAERCYQKAIEISSANDAARKGLEYIAGELISDPVAEGTIDNFLLPPRAPSPSQLTLLRPSIVCDTGAEEKAAPVSRVLVLGVYLAEQLNNAADIIAILSASQQCSVTQRWVALGGEPSNPELATVTVSTLRERRPKFQIMNDLLEKEDLSMVDYVLMTDDDVVMPVDFLDRFIAHQRRLNFALAQPARTSNSFIDHPIVEQHNGLLARQTRFVEIGPVVSFHRSIFDLVFPFDVTSAMGWGYENVWSLRVAERKLMMGIIDAVPVDHSLRPPVRNYDWSTADAERTKFLARHPHRPLDECFTVIDAVPSEGCL